MGYGEVGNRGTPLCLTPAGVVGGIGCPVDIVAVTSAIGLDVLATVGGFGYLVWLA